MRQTRWGDLIEEAKKFSVDSGLIEDVSRGELVSLVEDAISECRLEGRASALLCMLGESVVVLENELDGGTENLEVLSKKLGALGIKTKISQVGSLA